MAAPLLTSLSKDLIPVHLDVLVDRGCVTLTSPDLPHSISLEALRALTRLEVVKTVKFQETTVLYIELNPNTDWKTNSRQLILDTLWSPAQYQVIMTEAAMPTRTSHPFAVKDVDGPHVTLVAPRDAHYTEATLETIIRELRGLGCIKVCAMYHQNVGRCQLTNFLVEFTKTTWHAPGTREGILTALKRALASDRVRFVSV